MVILQELGTTLYIYNSMASKGDHAVPEQWDVQMWHLAGTQPWSPVAKTVLCYQDGLHI